jgi:hypothetical protein
VRVVGSPSDARRGGGVGLVPLHTSAPLVRGSAREPSPTTSRGGPRQTAPPGAKESGNPADSREWPNAYACVQAVGGPASSGRLNVSLRSHQCGALVRPAGAVRVEVLDVNARHAPRPDAQLLERQTCTTPPPPTVSSRQSQGRQDCR